MPIGVVPTTNISYYIHTVCFTTYTPSTNGELCEVYMKKVNVKSSLWTTWRHTEEEVERHSFLTSIVYGLIGRLHFPAGLSLDKQTHHRFNTSLGGLQDKCGLFGINLFPWREPKQDSLEVQATVY